MTSPLEPAFTSGFHYEGEPSPDSLWFAFQASGLLTLADQGTLRLPTWHDISQLDVALERRLYLGTFAGAHCFAIDVESSFAAEGLTFEGLRSLIGRLPEPLWALAGRAFQITDWDRTHRFCGRCGAPTLPRVSERSRECPVCKLVVYPRIAPAVMALVRRGDELLLARSPHFPPGRYSALAGFVEPGESLEETLAREVREEVGVEVANVRYFGSQPWPFPHSLMLAFHCDYAGGELKLEPTEIEDAAWFPIDHLPALPPRASIARRLIEDAISAVRAGAAPQQRSNSA